MDKQQKGAPKSAQSRDILSRVARIEGSKPLDWIEPEAPAPAEERAPAGSLESALAAFVDSRAARSVDEAKVRAIVADALSTLTPRDVRVLVNGEAMREIRGPVHPAFDQAVRRLGVGLPVMLVGPAGTGKTHLARQLAEALGLEWRGCVPFTSGTSEGALLGRLLPTGEGGSMLYHGTAFTSAFEQGGLVCLDEIDSADPNTLGALNSALANGETSLPARVDNPRAARHEGFRCVATANTWGLGGSREYVGRNQLDAATLDRFRMGRVLVDYDSAFERALIGADSDKAMSELHGRWSALRAKAFELKLRVIVSTRSLLDASRLILGAGLTVQDCERILALDWNDDVRTKLGVQS